MSTSETITRADLANILNEVLPNTSVDYIVEQGTSGIWTYRKWASGVAECWGAETSGTFAPSSTSGGGVSYRILTQAFPTGLFNAVPMANVNAQWGTGVSWASARNITASSLEYVTLKLNNSSESANFYFSAHGRWK